MTYNTALETAARNSLAQSFVTTAMSQQDETRPAFVAGRVVVSAARRANSDR